MCTYLVIQKSIDRLRTIEYDVRGFKHHEFSFYALMKFIRQYEDYGRIWSYEIELFHNGTNEIIEIDGYKFDNNVSYSYHRSSAMEHGFTKSIRLIGETPNGEPFSVNILWNSSVSVLEQIVYTIISVTRFGPQKVSEILYSFYSTYRYNESSLADILKNIDDIRNTFCRLNREFPFFKAYYSEGIQKWISLAETKLDDFKLIEYATLD